MRFLVAGAGLSGAVVARQLAEAGHAVTIHEARDHVSGNCHTARDPETGVLVHRYGPHIFHTADERVWNYVCRFTEMVPYRHRVRTTVGGRVYSLPVNLQTINQLYDAAMTPAEARALLAAESESGEGVSRNFEELALRTMGRRIYEAFFAGYTRKQWGLEPRELPVSVLKRLPLRFDYEDAYYDHPHQAMPRLGYTEMVEAILDHPQITVLLSSPLAPGTVDGAHVVWTGPLDAWFEHQCGRLRYRTLDFEVIRGDGDLQGCAVMNYGDADVPYTRTCEHKHLTPWEQPARTLCYRERSRDAGPDDIPYYPVRLATDQQRLQDYLDAARDSRGVTFLGRLGTYRYLDMDVAIGEALTTAERIATAVERRERIPSLGGTATAGSVA